MIQYTRYECCVILNGVGVNVYSFQTTDTLNDTIRALIEERILTPEKISKLLR